MCLQVAPASGKLAELSSIEVAIGHGSNIAATHTSHAPAESCWPHSKTTESKLSATDRSRTVNRQKFGDLFKAFKREAPARQWAACFNVSRRSSVLPSPTT